MPSVSEGIHSCFGLNGFSRIAAVAVLQTTRASLVDRDRRERGQGSLLLSGHMFFCFFSPPAGSAWGGRSELARVGWGDLKNKPYLLLAGCTSLKMVLMQPDMEIMFAFSFFQCRWCISKLHVTVPSHQAVARPAAWDRCWPERPLTHPVFQIASDRCQSGHGTLARSLVSQPYTLTFKASDIALVKEQTPYRIPSKEQRAGNSGGHWEALGTAWVSSFPPALLLT